LTGHITVTCRPWPAYPCHQVRKYVLICLFARLVRASWAGAARRLAWRLAETERTEPCAVATSCAGGRAGQRAGGQSNCGFGGGRSLGVSHLAAKPARNAPPVRRSQLCAHRPAGHTFLPRRAARFVIQKRSGAPALALPASASTFMSRPEAIGNRQQLALRRSSVQYSIQSTSSMFQASNCLQQHCSSAASSFFFEPERAGMPARQERMEGR
jgi:hypothetical protein